jgi:2-methylcitrate dehydratase PrpD
MIIVDTLAASVAGAADTSCRKVIKRLLTRAGTAESSVIGSTKKISAVQAAFCNALPTTVLQIDEGHRESRGHPGIHVVPAALAVAEEVDATGEQLISAVVAGYEVAASIGMAIGPFRRDLHPHGNWAAIGAAVAATKLRGGSDRDIATAIDASAALALSPYRGTVATGRTVHHLYAALGTQSAILVSDAVLEGVTVVENTLEDFFLPTFAAEKGGVRSRRATEFEILRNYFKFYAACAHTHTTLQAVEEILARSQIHARQVKQIDVETYAAAADLADPTPASNLAARFSIPFLVGHVIANGRITPKVFTPRELEDVATRKVANVVRLHLNPALDQRYPEARPARVTVTTYEGDVFASEQDMAIGDPAGSVPDADWRAKIMKLLGARDAATMLRFVDESPQSWRPRDIGDAVGSLSSR